MNNEPKYNLKYVLEYLIVTKQLEIIIEEVHESNCVHQQDDSFTIDNDSK